MSLVNGYGAYKQYSYDVKGKKTGIANADKQKNTDRTGKAEKNTEAGSQVQLSEKAKKLLEELKQKYGNMDFFIADYDSEEEAQSYLSKGTKEYSVLIDPATLEAMAADDATKEKYMGLIDDATGKLSQMKDELSEDENNVVRSIGITIDKDGNISYFAELEKMSEKQRERIKESKEEAKAEEEEAAKRKERQEERERLQSPGRELHIPKTIQRVSLKADSAEALLEKIRSVDWSQIKASWNGQPGTRFDFSI